MLQFIFGRSGSGKTQYIRQLAGDLIKQGNKKVMIIIPEQNSFESERSMLKLLGAKEALKVEVLSFTRLINIVSQKYGGISGKFLEDSGRLMFTSLALQEVKEELAVYKNSCERIEFVQTITDMIKQFKQGVVTPDTLLALSHETKDSLLNNKVKDLALVYDAYEALISQGFVDPIDNLTRLDAILAEHKFFSEYTVLIDSFKGFSQQEYNILKHIFKQAKNIYMTFPIQAFRNDEDVFELFSEVQNTVQRINRLAKQMGVKVAKPIMLNENKRAQNQELALIERGIYQISNEISDKPPENIYLYKAENIYEETDFVAREILRMVREEGYRFRDFAVVARNAGNYERVIEYSFEQYGISYFMDKSQRIEKKALMVLVCSMLEIVIGKYQSEDIFRYLKTGLVGFDTEKIALIENYTYLWSISGRKWLEEWTLHPNGFEEKFSDNDKKTLKDLESLRKKIIVPLKVFENKLNNAEILDGLEIARAIYEHLEKIDASKSFLAMQKIWEENKAISNLEEEVRLWDLLMELLNQTAIVLRGKKISLKQYLYSLSLAIAGSDMSFIPQGIDQVLVGSAEHIRMENPKVLFVIGANEGVFPASSQKSGIFSDAECRILSEAGAQFADTAQRRSAEERFIVYSTLTAVCKKLIVSWYTADIDGSEKSQSSMIAEIQKLFPLIDIKNKNDFDQLELLQAQIPSFDKMARMYSEPSVLLETLKQYYNSQPEYNDKMQAMQRVTLQKNLKIEDKRIAKDLFGNDMILSASKVEKYYMCPFQYFCQYGLNAYPRKKAEVDNLEYGTIMHYLLERTISEYGGDGIIKLSEEEISILVRRLLQEYIDTYMKGVSEGSSRYGYLFNRLAITAQKLILHIANEMAQSEFRPVANELSIAEDGEILPLEIPLAGGGKLSVKGYVDRVDMYEKDGKSYIRIIDYKTGSKDFHISDLSYGLNMQMMIYLSTIWKNGEEKFGNVVPAGVLYMLAGYKNIFAERSEDPKSIKAKQTKQFAMKGLILNEIDVVKAMEKNLAGVYIPIKYDKNNNPSATAKESLASISQMGILAKHIERLLKEMAENLQDGKIIDTPVTGDYDACEWCQYFSVCRHECAEDIEVKKLKKDDFFKIIQDDTTARGEE